MTARWVRIAMFVLAAGWIFFGVWRLAEGEYLYGGFKVVLGVAWLLLAFYRDRFNAWIDVTRERQRAAVRGHNAISFPADRPPRSGDG